MMVELSSMISTERFRRCNSESGLRQMRATTAPVFLIAIFGCLSLCACGWEEKVEFRNERSGATITVLQPRPINEAGVRVVLSESAGDSTLYSRRVDTFIQFADAAWSRDGSAVAVFLCGAGPLIQIGYDLRAHRRLSFSSLRPMLVEHIREEYGVTSSNDDEVLRWACTDG